MNDKLRYTIIFAGVSGLADFGSCAYGQVTEMPNLQLLQTQIEALKQLPASWEAMGNVEFSLAMLVVILGALVAALQKIEGKKWCSYFVAACGIAISILTFGTKEYFDVDHKTYRTYAGLARGELSVAEQYLSVVNSPGVDPADSQKYLVEISKIITKVNSMALTVANIKASQIASVDLISAAHAEPSSHPAWVSQPRTETGTSYSFVGSSTSSSVAAGESQAILAAHNAAASGLSIPLDTVSKYSVLADRYFEYNAAQKTYLCYVRVEINKAFVHR
jgi:hypothetical protein